MNILNIIVVLILIKLTVAKAPIEVLFLIRSQDVPTQNQLSKQLKGNLIRQSVELQPDYTIKVQILHELFNYPGEWTILHVIPHLMSIVPPASAASATRTMSTTTTTTTKQIEIGMELITNLTRWIVFCEDTTSVNVRSLLQRLNAENHTQPLLLGQPLYDREPTIIHHFAFFENPKWFPYPMLRAGIVFSMPLLKSIADIFGNRNKQLKQPLLRSEFSIDAAHMLARFIYDNVQIPVATAKTTDTTTASATDTATTRATSSQNDSESPAVNVYHRTTRGATMTTSDDATTTSHTGRQTNTRTTRALAHVNVNVGSTSDDDDAGNASDLSHSDFRHTNEIIDGTKTKKTTTTNAATTKRQKIILKKASYICPVPVATGESVNQKNNEPCAMYAAGPAPAPASEATSAPSAMSCDPVKRDQIYFAVKTCSRYHEERLPIIQSTWAPYAKHIKYYSDIEDADIPTINVGVANVEMGHCAKTLQILKLALRDIENYNRIVNTNTNTKTNQDNGRNKDNNRLNQPQHNKDNRIRWLFLTDDDTLLSVSGVCQVLGCYNSMDEIYLGERYGYRLYAPDGFNYITGGGGIAFSLSVVKLIVQHCSCPSPSAPDDMILGSCLHALQLKALHSSRFHQARPNDYPMERLRQEAPVSFHKFWQLDPNEVYKQWFFDDDDRLLLKDARAVVTEEEGRREHHKKETVHYYHKNRNLLATKAEVINFNDFVPVSLIAALHHSKERHVDL